MLKVLLDQVTSPPSPMSPPPEAEARILYFAHRKARPFLLGALADDIGWSLERTERYAQALVSLGKLRLATVEEIEHISSIKCVIVYCVPSVDPILAHIS
jgi:hypothetical protein